MKAAALHGLKRGGLWALAFTLASVGTRAGMALAALISHDPGWYLYLSYT